ncbi:MAG TPA: nucleoside-diphosphate sugar epimerase/dehydratase [Candidatus Binataceae bacterium]|nr:nucleoside-diphosphate sugar epimerase/dehydratase [Candidatus Binataceae bacterium]
MALIGLAYLIAFELRFDLTFLPVSRALLWAPLPWIFALQTMFYFAFGIHQIVWRYVAPRDLARIGLFAICAYVAFQFVVNVLFKFAWYPRSIFLLDPMLLIFLLGGARALRRLLYEFPNSRPTKRILIYGAGDAGAMIVREMMHTAYYDYRPVGFIDDDRAKVGRRIHGYRVLGTRHDVKRVVSRLQPDEILLAMPRVPPSVVRGVIKALETIKLPVKTLPSLRDVMHGIVKVSDIRQIDLADLLGRDPVDLDPETVGQLITGKSILVTGAGGSIGAELCRQIWALQPRTLAMFEKHENSLYAIEAELRDGRGADDRLVIEVGDVCDAARVSSVLAKHRSEIVFHAAAHKHVPLMERNPCEAVKNNVGGTRVVATAAARAGVERFILVSTDKAVNPSSVMGVTKRIAELVVEDIARGQSCKFGAVRFGNVMGSNGSVIPRFQAQLSQGGPLTVTHPDMRRYFMLIPEAVALMLHSAAIIESGAIYVLEMGDQIRVDDIARHMIRLAGLIPDEDIQIIYTGIRAGEKMSEELIGHDEQARPTASRAVTMVHSKGRLERARLAQHLETLEAAAEANRDGDVTRALELLVPSFRYCGEHRSEIGEVTDDIDSLRRKRA